MSGASNGLCEHASSAYIFASTSNDRAARTLEITNGEQRALRNFPPAGTLFCTK